MSKKGNVEEIRKIYHYSEEKYNLYKNRIIAYSIFLVLSVTLCVFLSFGIVKKEEIKETKYSDTGVVDYKVYLKENEFYTEPYLEKNKSYITNLIDYIDVNYNYIFKIDNITDVSFKYRVIGKLIIENDGGNTKGPLLEKEYVIIDSKEKELNGTNELVINEKFQLDYSYYNQLANKFRSVYGVDTISNLKVYLEVTKNSPASSSYDIHETSNMDEVVIPLSEKAIEIPINTKDNNSSKILPSSITFNVNYYIIGLLALFGLFSIYFIRIIIKSYQKLITKRSEYDRYVKKILREYDRLVIETKTLLNLSEFNLIRVEKFTELLDVRDNMKLPINYYCIKEHEKGMFYIKSNNDIYILYIDLNNIEN